MSKTKDKKITDTEKVQEPPADQGLPKPGTLPSETEPAPSSAGSEPEEEEKAPPVPPQKKKKNDEIVGLMGTKHVPGPPGSWHG